MEDVVSWDFAPHTGPCVNKLRTEHNKNKIESIGVN